jgi:glycosyltransferase involved in cell wall biosynthesis
MLTSSTPFDKAARPHILVLAPFFPPFRGAVASRLSSFARYWSDLTQVTVLSPYPGDASVQGYDLIKFPLARWRAEPLKIPFTFSKLLILARRLKPDVVLASIPPAWSLLESYLLTRRLGCKLILDVRDLPKADVRKDRTSLTRKLFHILGILISRCCGRKASRIVAVTDWFRNESIKFFDYSPSRIFVVRNGSEVGLFKQALSVKKEFDIVYSGTLIYVRNPQGILKYLRAVADLYPSLRALFIADFNSSIGKEFMSGVEEMGLSENVVMKQPYPPQELPSLLGSARLGLNGLVSGLYHYQGAIGAKEYDYLAAGLPIMGLLDSDYYIEEGQLIRDNDAGIVNHDPKLLAGETAALLRDPRRLQRMSINARQTGERFDRRRLAEDYFYNVIIPAWKESRA